MGEQSLSNLMKVTIESPETLVDKDLENVWNKEVERLLFYRFNLFGDYCEVAVSVVQHYTKYISLTIVESMPNYVHVQKNYYSFKKNMKTSNGVYFRLP